MSAAVNTDREIWRGPDTGDGSYYADSIHVTEDGGIGIPKIALLNRNNLHMPRTPWTPPKFDTRLSRDAALAHPTFLQTVMALWDKGNDTNEIARVLFENEEVITFCVRIGREQRRESAAFA